jgi:hypothetical protein
MHFHTLQQPQMGEWRGYKLPKTSKESLAKSCRNLYHRMIRRSPFHRRQFIRCSSTSRSRCQSADATHLTLHLTLHPTVRRFIRCWRLRGQKLTVLNFIATGWTDAWSVGSSSATSCCTRASLSCACEPPDRSTVPSNGPSVCLTPSSLRLHLCNSSDATRNWTVGSSDGALAFTQCTNSSNHCTDACYLSTVGSFDCVLSFLFLLRFWPLKFLHVIFLHPWDLEMYKDMLNNLVSLINHVVINHQNQTWTNGLWGHVRYNDLSHYWALPSIEAIIHCSACSFG